MDLSLQQDFCASTPLEKTKLELIEKKKVSAFCSKLQFLSGPSFFISERYFNFLNEDDLFIGSVFSGARLEELMHSAYCYVVEHFAMNYLNRAEQCRKGLTVKLYKKGFKKEIIEQVLDVLEEERFLDDSRFAQAWIQNRMIRHTEGKIKLFAELCSRGINKNVAQKAIDNYFENIDENIIFEKALCKCKNLGYDDVKIVKKLMNLGFDYKIIKNTIK